MANERTRVATSAPPPLQLVAYGGLALPVAVVSLPVYIHIPQFYAGTIGLDLALIGWLLLAIRLIDTVQDPFFGLLSDQLMQRGHHRLRLIAYAVPGLIAGLLMLVNPPGASVLWFVVSLLLLYSAFSFIYINYYAYGAEWRADYDAQSIVSTWREAFILIGVILASLLPQWLMNSFGEREGYSYFGWAITAAILLILPVAYCLLPAGTSSKRDSTSSSSWWRSAKTMLKSGPYRWLICIFFLNSLANSIPATLILFYLSDVLQLKEQSGYFLGTYFLAGLLAMPLWLQLAKCWGKKRTLMLSMILASLSFVWAFTLGAGDAIAFYVICVISGACLGADNAMPPAMLGDVIHADKIKGAAGYFGVWNLVWKLSFAVAAGLTLPLLAWLGYQPDQPSGQVQGTTMLAMMYALMPSIIKLVAAVLLYLSPLEAARFKANLQTESC